MVILSSVEDYGHINDLDTKWVVDSTTLYHATSRRDVFTMYKTKSFGRVKMGNTSYTDIICIGDICV